MSYRQTISQSTPDPSPDAAADIDWPEQLHALADPTRFAIFSAAAWGRCTTVKEIAARIGRDPGALYRHFERLVEVGLLEVVGTVPTSRRAARVYRAPSEPRFRYRPDEPEMVEALCALVRSASRHAARGVERSLDGGRAMTRGPQRDTLLETQSGWLDDDDLEELNRMAEDMRRFVLSRTRRPGSRHIETTLMMAPCADAPPTETNGDD